MDRKWRRAKSPSLLRPRFLRQLLKLGSELGRAASEQEIARELGMELSEFQALLAELDGLEITTLNPEPNEEGREGEGIDAVADEQHANPFEQCLRDEMKALLAQSLSCLPEREKQVLVLYYYEELTMKEVGAVLGVGESRVSQIHSLAITRLRSRMQQESKKQSLAAV